VGKLSEEPDRGEEGKSNKAKRKSRDALLTRLKGTEAQGIAPERQNPKQETRNKKH